MKLPDHPALRLRIKPSFSSSNEATHLSLTFSLQQPQTGPHRVLFTFSTFNDNVPSHPYKENDIHAEDAAGRLHLNFFSPNDKSGGQEEFLQEWRVHRDVVGDVTLKMDVYPRKVNINTPLGARVDLRTDQGGLQGAGRWFLPRLLAEDSTRLYTNIVEWDLCSAPPRTRAIWSHGEGPQAVIKVGTTSTLVDTVYMVGPIQSYPPKAMPGSVPGFCGSYWFGRLPKNLDRLKDFNSAIFKPMAEMFKDEGSSYRIFIRSAVLGYGGTGFDASYVLEYDGRTAMNSDQDIQALFAHEMVHSFIQMPPEKDDSDDNGWFVEGIAEFYAVILPYRFGILDSDFLRASVNCKLSGYYTNPEIHMSSEESRRTFFSNWYAEKIPYLRGFAYLLLVDARLRRASGITDAAKPSPLDDVVVKLAKRWRRGEVIGQKDWLRGIGKILGNEVDLQRELRATLEGGIVDLSDAFVGSPENKFKPTQQRILEFGFGRLSLSTRVVEGVVPGSNAEKVGVQNGDKILENQRGGMVDEDPVALYYIHAQRGNQEMMFEWLPRQEKMALCYQLGGVSD